MRKLAFKLGISLIVVVYILVFRIDFSSFLRTIKEVHLGWFFLALFLHTFGYLISGFRWKAISEELNIDLPLLFFVKSYLVATFFGFFLPSRFGGDIIRIGDMSTERELSSGISTVFYERVVGLFSLVILGILALAVSPPEVKNLVLITFIILFSVLFLTTLLLIKPEVLLWIPLKGKWRIKLKSIYNSIKKLQSRKLFLKTLLWSLLLQINVIIHYWAIGKAVGIHTPFLAYFFLIPTMLILMAIPISFQGIGVRDYFAVSVFPLYGATAEQGFLFSSVDLFIAIILSFIGLIVYLLRK